MRLSWPVPWPPRRGRFGVRTLLLRRLRPPTTWVRGDPQPTPVRRDARVPRARQRSSPGRAAPRTTELEENACPGSTSPPTATRWCPSPGSNLTIVVVVAVIALAALGVAAVVGPRGARRRRGHREDEGDRAGGPGGRRGLPEPAVPHAVGLRRRSSSSCCSCCRRTPPSERIGRSIFFLVGALLLGDHRLHRHVARRARQRARGRRGATTSGEQTAP